MKTPSELVEVVQLRRFVPSAFKIGSNISWLVKSI